VAEWADPMNGELFIVVTRLEPGPMEFSHPLDQRYQAGCHLRILLRILQQRRKEMLVQPFGRILQVDVEPPS
jgi:hypothetical protein